MNDVEKFLEHALIKKVFEHREAELEALMAADKAAGTKLKGRSARARSVMALSVQQKELELLLPVYKLLEDNEEVTIMLYQFDGITVRYKNEKTRGIWEDKIKEAVKLKAEELGILTRLEGERVCPPDPPPPYDRWRTTSAGVPIEF